MLREPNSNQYERSSPLAGYRTWQSDFDYDEPEFIEDWSDDEEEEVPDELKEAV